MHRIRGLGIWVLELEILDNDFLFSINHEPFSFNSNSECKSTKHLKYQGVQNATIWNKIKSYFRP